jgi:hypothetical protein
MDLENDFELKDNLQYQVDLNMGFYPKAVTQNGVTTERSEYGNGWNDALSERNSRLIAYEEWFFALDKKVAEVIRSLVITETLDLGLKKEKDSDKFIVRPYLNMNDTFAYSCADAEPVEMNEIDAVASAFEKFGDEGIIAWASVKRKEMPIKPRQTDKFKEAYKELSSGV